MQNTTKPKLSEREIAEAWAKITIQLWRKNLTRMKIGQNSSGDLNRSFKYKVIAGARGNEDRIEFAFNYYGKFRLSELHPKKWYSRTFYGEAQRLFENLQKEYGRNAQVVISENINDNSIK